MSESAQLCIVAAGTRVSRVATQSRQIASGNRTVETNAHDPARRQAFDQRPPALERISHVMKNAAAFNHAKTREKFWDCADLLDVCRQQVAVRAEDGSNQGVEVPKFQVDTLAKRQIRNRDSQHPSAARSVRYTRICVRLTCGGSGRATTSPPAACPARRRARRP